MMIESQQITIPQIPELINELKLYGYKTSSSGNVQYGAPEGYYDDCVTAPALAAWQLRRSNPPVTSRSVGFIQHEEVKRIQQMRFWNEQSRGF